MDVFLPNAAAGRVLSGCWRVFFLVAGLLVVGWGWLSGRVAAAPFDFSGPVTTISVSPGAGAVSLNALDPGVGGLVTTNVVLVGGTASPSDAQAAGGFAAWSSGTRVYYWVYDAYRRQWVGTNANTGATFDLRNTNGVIAWTSGSTAHYAAYNWTRSVWVKDSQAVGSSATTFDVVDGVAAGSTGAGVFYAVFDPRSGVWVKNSAATGIPGEFRNSQGLVAWTAGNFVYGRAYDPVAGVWKDANMNAGGTPFDLRNSGGVVAWTRNPTVGYAVYDSPRSRWVAEAVSVGFATDLIVSNSTVYWNTSLGGYRRGYRLVQTGGTNYWWTNNVTGVEASFLASTNRINSPVTIAFIDLSLGGSSWLWNFGGGEGTTGRRSPLVRFPVSGQYVVSQTVSGDGGFSTTNLLVVTDVTPPTGSVTINNGEAVTTNRNVTLQLSAADVNGTVVSMRLANDTTNTWSEWEAYATVKSWTLTAGGGVKTVYAQFRDAGGNVSTNASDTINYDDAPPPVLTFLSTNALESAQSVVVRAVLDHAVNRTVSAGYFTSDGTARDGEDYTQRSGVVVFAPNTTVATVTIPLLPDALVELNETIQLNLQNPTNAVLAGPGTVTILDDDNASVSFASANFNAAEDAGVASVVVRLNAASGQTVSVRVLAQPGSAVDGQDFVATNGVLVFLPGQTNRTFNVPVLDDLADELTETVSLSLTNLTNGVLGVPAQGTVSILDNDQPFIFFSADGYRGFEDEFSIPVRVWLSKPFSQQVSASYTIFGGTAAPGVDYTVLGNVIIPAGTTNATITVFPINDGGRETDETIRLRLTDIAGAAPGRTETTVTLLDEDGAPRFVAVDGVGAVFRAELRGRADQVFNVESSTNLAAWSFFRRLTNSGAGTSSFSVPAVDPPRYYRAVSP